MTINKNGLSKNKPEQLKENYYKESIMKDISYCSDKYQYTMGKSFLDCGMQNKKAVFNLFFRKAPDNNNWAVVSGIKEAMQMIESLGGKSPEFFENFLEYVVSSLCRNI